MRLRRIRPWAPRYLRYARRSLAIACGDTLGGARLSRLPAAIRRAPLCHVAFRGVTHLSLMHAMRKSRRIFVRISAKSRCIFVRMLGKSRRIFVRILGKSPCIFVRMPRKSRCIFVIACVRQGFGGIRMEHGK